MRRAAAAVGALATLALLAGCTAGTPSRARPPAPPTASSTHVNSQLADVELQAMAQRIVHRRERAVRRHDLRAYLADLDPANSALLARERRRFANLVQLPLKTYQLDAVATTLAERLRRRDGSGTPPTSRTSRRRCSCAASTPRRSSSRPASRSRGSTVAGASCPTTTSPTGRPSGSRNPPWDLTRIVVRRSPHALGIFDAASAASADRLMAWTEESVGTVRRARARAVARPGGVLRAVQPAAAAGDGHPVPGPRRHRVPGLRRREAADPAGGDPGRDQPALPAAHRARRAPTCSATSSPTSPWRAPTAATPAWVQEGLADYVATRGASPAWWLPSAASVARARKGADAMPGSTFFGDDDPAFEYDLSLAACAVLADRFGTDRLWGFLEPAVRGRVRRRGRRGAHATRCSARCSAWTRAGWPAARPGWSSRAVPDGHPMYANRYLEGRALLTVMGFNDQVFVRRATLGDLIAHEETPHVPHPHPAAG